MATITRRRRRTATAILTVDVPSAEQVVEIEVRGEFEFARAEREAGYVWLPDRWCLIDWEPVEATWYHPDNEHTTFTLRPGSILYTLVREFIELPDGQGHEWKPEEFDWSWDDEGDE